MFRIAIFSGRNLDFDGDFALIAPPDTPVEQIAAIRQDARSDRYRPARPDWILVSGGRDGIYPGVWPGRVHLKPVQIDGRLFFIAKPADEDDRPTAVLIGLGKDLKPFAACQFNRVEPNFGVPHKD